MGRALPLTCAMHRFVNQGGGHVPLREPPEGGAQAGALTVDDTRARLGNTVVASLAGSSTGFAGPLSSLLLFSANPAPQHPCGFPFRGNEVLVSFPTIDVTGPTWTGAPREVPLRIPNTAGLVGGAVYMQALLIGATGGALTDGLEIVIGQ